MRLTNFVAHVRMQCGKQHHVLEGKAVGEENRSHTGLQQHLRHRGIHVCLCMRMGGGGGGGMVVVIYEQDLYHSPIYK